LSPKIDKVSEEMAMRYHHEGPCVVQQVQQRVVAWKQLGNPRKDLRGGISKVNFQETWSIFGDKCPQNSSKNDPMAPRTTLECPHEGPSVDWVAMLGSIRDKGISSL
jgi:hypothetical protein